jgi:hypothetical protein
MPVRGRGLSLVALRQPGGLHPEGWIGSQPDRGMPKIGGHFTDFCRAGTLMARPGAATASPDRTIPPRAVIVAAHTRWAQQTLAGRIRTPDERQILCIQQVTV